MGTFTSLLAARTAAKLEKHLGTVGEHIGNKLTLDKSKRPSFGSLMKRDVGSNLAKNFGLLGAYADHRLNHSSKASSGSSSTGTDDKHKSRTGQKISGSDVTDAIAESGTQVLAELQAVDHTAKLG